jgi:hypothetical protein
MPPHTLSPAAVSRYLYLVTAFIVSSVVVWVGFAGAGPPDPQCRGNSPKKICPKLTPSSGDTVSDKVTVVAEVPEAVTAVEFKVNDKPLAPEDVEAPFETAWDTTKWPDGKYTLSATARDLNGNASTRENLVTVSNAPPDTSAPSVELTSPAAGATVSGSITVGASASDDVAVVGVQFKVNGANIEGEDTSAPYSVSWDTTKVSNGSHTLSAVARDAAGNTASSQRTVTVSNASAPPGDTSAPTVELTSPAAGATVSSSIAVAANASDNVGVVGVQFKVNGTNLGSEDTTAPYSVSWDTTKVSNGSHTLSAVARDAAGNTSSSQRTVTVSNTSSPSDTTAPTVQLTSPEAGSTVSGQEAISANASDDVGVVGVQFKIDGANIGSEDTTAPYSVSWDTTKTSNGSHTVTAVARDAAGTTSSAQRTVTVSNTSSSSGPKLTWAPPALTSPVTIEVTNANKQLNLDKSRDYVLKIKEKLVGRPGLWIEGGRNVVVVGGHIEMNSEGTSSYWDRTAVKVRYSTGVVHLEGLLINGAYLADGIVTAAPAATLQIQNVRVENAHATGSEHPDCLQTQAGLGALRIDRFSCSTQLQGIFLQAASSDLKVGPADIRNTNIEGAGGKYLFWQETKDVGPISLSNVWIKGNDPKWADFGMWVWPNKNAEGQSDPTRRAIVSSDGSYLTFQNSNISGRIYKGAPSGGDFVPRSLVGLGYVSPGYS